MISPMFCNAAEVMTFKMEKEDMVMVRFFFIMPKMAQKTEYTIPIEKIPVSTILMTRQSYKLVMKRFLGFLGQQEQGSLGPIPGMEGDENGKSETK